MSTLPVFRYHPDPVATGSIVASDERCDSCQLRRGFVYTGPTYGVNEVEFLCPWCIADGSASRRWGAEFIDVGLRPEGVPANVIEELGSRTPGFISWQGDTWMYHCDDGAMYLGMAGWDLVRGHDEAVAMLLEDGWSEEVLPGLDVDGDFTAYLFRCRHCGVVLAYADAA